MIFELMLSLRYLQSKGGKFLCSIPSVVSIVGVAIGVATLISVMSVMNGFSAKLLDSILQMSGHLSIHCGNSNYRDIVAKTESIGGVVSATPVIESQIVVRSEFGTTGAVVRGMESSVIEGKLLKYIVNGNTSVLDIEDGIIIGTGLADTLGVYCGDEVVVISSAGFTDAMNSKQRKKRYRVKGIFNVGMQEHDSAYIYMPIEESRMLLHYKADEADYIEVLLENVNDSSNVADALRQAWNMNVEDWKVRQAQYFHVLKLERDAMFFILVLIVVVASLNIVSCVSVLVREKSRAIAIMRTMGLSKAAVIRIFSMCGMFIGVLGTAIGGVIGVAFSLNAENIRVFLRTFDKGAFFESIAYCLDGISVGMISGDVIQVALVAIGMSFVAALPPALRAACQNPVDVLKYE
ncbi:ABC transporter permease [Anaplasma bovis]|uniref:ABC transporter permease n=1 Tax=Anaplasma bovis TaxID=186733 RepID=UPI002FF1CD17